MKKTIESALETLVKNSGDGWSCILEEPKTEKFVQFAYDEGEGIWFDLPKPALTAEEFKIASALLPRYNIELITPDMGSDDCDCDCKDEDCDCEDEDCDSEDDTCECGDCGFDGNDSFETFNKNLKYDTKLGAEIAYAVMKEIYKLKDTTKLNVTIIR